MTSNEIRNRCFTLITLAGEPCRACVLSAMIDGTTTGEVRQILRASPLFFKITKGNAERWGVKND